MVHALKMFLKSSPLGGPLRALQGRIELRHLPNDQYREQRDDRAMLDLMTRILTPDSACVDVGANRGRILTMMTQLAPLGPHIAIEPIPHLAFDLHRRFPSTRVHCCALNDTPGLAELNHVIDMNGWSGLRLPADGYTGRIEKIPVQLMRLDDLVPAKTIVRLIKIDVEGAELQVLRGARATIRRSKPYVVFEYGELHGVPYGTTSKMIYDELTLQCGLTVHSLLGSQPRLSRERFGALCRHATDTHYDRASQGNFLATPKSI